MDTLDISDFSEVKERPKIHHPQYGKSYTVKSKI